MDQDFGQLSAVLVVLFVAMKYKVAAGKRTFARFSLKATVADAVHHAFFMELYYNDRGVPIDSDGHVPIVEDFGLGSELPTILPQAEKPEE